MLLFFSNNQFIDGRQTKVENPEVFCYYYGMNEMSENIGVNAETEEDELIKSQYDSAWKSVIRKLFKDFFEFFYPEIHAAIDYSKGIEFLDKELKEIAPDSNQGDRVADVLAKVHLKDGSTQYICIVIHIEVQASRRSNFMERMFIYFYRAFDSEMERKIPVISVAMLTDGDPSFRPKPFKFNLFGFKLRMEIPIVKTLDYKLKEDLKKKLETSTNPMALVVKAQLKSLDVKHSDDDTKFEVTKELIRQLIKNGYPRNETRIIMNFIAWVIRVPDRLKDRIKRVIIEAEEEFKMEYKAPWFRDEFEKGIEKGKREATRENALEFLRNGAGIDLVVKSTGFTREEVEKMAETVH